MTGAPAPDGPATFIADPAGLAAVLARFRTEPLVAIDTEAASFHRYRDRVYFLQMSTRTETALVDPLAVPGLPGLDGLLADPAIELVFHDADYDLRLLHHEFGFRAARLFDTRVAAQFLNEPQFGLAALLEKHFGVRVDKRYQRADWSARPLSPAMLEYAATDTRHLPALRDLLRERLARADRLTWVEEECALVTTVEWPPAEPPEVGYLRLKGARALAPRGLAVLRELFTWRERTSAALDRAPFRVLGNESLLLLAERPPADLEALGRVRGVGRDALRRSGADLLDAIQRALALPESELPRRERPPRYPRDPAVETRLERLKVARAAAARRLDLPPGLVAPNWLLERIARAAPATPGALAAVEGIRRWQVATIGEDLLRVATPERP